MPHSLPLTVRDLRRGDCVLLSVGKVDRWCDVEALMVPRPGESILVVVPHGDERHRSLTLDLHPDDAVLVVRGVAPE